MAFQITDTDLLKTLEYREKGNYIDHEKEDFAFHLEDIALSREPKIDKYGRKKTYFQLFGHTLRGNTVLVEFVPEEEKDCFLHFYLTMKETDGEEFKENLLLNLKEYEYSAPYGKKMPLKNKWDELKECKIIPALPYVGFRYVLTFFIS